MFNVKLQVQRQQVSPHLKNIQRQLDKIPDRSLEFFKYGAPTPVKSGNARRNTRLIGNEIRADYPYATKLDEGSSQQSPDGMSEPTIEHIRKLAARAMKGGVI